MGTFGLQFPTFEEALAEHEEKKDAATLIPSHLLFLNGSLLSGPRTKKGWMENQLQPQNTK